MPIAPGVIETDFHVRHNNKERLQGIAQNTPLQRNGTVDDMAAAALLLCGDGGAFMTGEVININGGLWFA
jgi:3-oxoacyl-[acyl-carrier protein] reductase